MSDRDGYITMNSRKRQSKIDPPFPVCGQQLSSTASLLFSSVYGRLLAVRAVRQLFIDNDLVIEWRHRLSLSLNLAWCLRSNKTTKTSKMNVSRRDRAQISWSLDFGAAAGWLWKLFPEIWRRGGYLICGSTLHHTATNKKELSKFPFDRRRDPTLLLMTVVAYTQHWLLLPAQSETKLLPTFADFWFPKKPSVVK